MSLAVLGMHAHLHTADHLVPVARGGGNGLDNLVGSCTHCNQLRRGAEFEGGTTYAFSQRMPTTTISPALSDGEGFVADSSRLGRFTPARRASRRSWTTLKNTYLVRYESNTAFAVHRSDAICTLAGTS